MIQLGGEADFPEKAVGSDADQQLGMKNLEGDLAAGRVGGQEDSSIPTPADLALDIIPSGEGLAHQRQHVAPNGRVLERDASMVTCGLELMQDLLRALPAGGRALLQTA